MSCFGAFAGGIERGCQIESCLMIERVCGDFLFQFSDRTNRLGLLGEIKRCLHRFDGGIITLRFRDHGKGLLGLLGRAGRNIAFCEARQRGDIGSVRSENFGVDLRGAGRIVLGEHGVRFLEDFGIVPFLDAGTVSRNAAPSFDQPIQYAVGLGLRYYTSFGPIRADVAVPMNPRGEDDPIAFYVSIGQAF